MDYLLHVLVLFFLYAILTTSLDLLVGHSGLLSIAHAGLYGIGAYAAAIVSTHFDISFLGSVAIAMLAGVLVSFCISLPSRGLKGDYFAVLTFALQMVLFHLLNGWDRLTGGPLGISGIPAPAVFGAELDTLAETTLLFASCAGVVFALSRNVATSPFGRVLHALREDEGLTQSLGKHTYRVTIQVCAMSGAFAALAGALYSHYITYVDPTGFTVVESILILAMVILGGPGTILGPIIGAISLVSLAEALRFIGIPASEAASLRQIVYGLALIAIVFLRPRGLARA